MMKREHWGLLLVVLVGALLRFRGIGARSLWCAEALSASLLQYDYTDIVRRCAGQGSVYPPLYFILLKTWASVAGESEAALRAFSGAFGLVTVIGVYFLVLKLAALSGRQPLPRAGAAGLLAASMVALSPMQIELARTVRAYTLATATITLSELAVLHALSGRSRKVWWVLASTIAAASCYAHNIAVFSVFSIGVFVGAHVWFPRHGPERQGPASREVGQLRPCIGARPTAWHVAHGWRPYIALLVFMLCYLVPWALVLIAQSQTVLHERFRFVTSRLTWYSMLIETCLALVSSFDAPHAFDRVEVICTCAGVAGMLAYMIVRGGPSRWFLALTGILPPIMMASYSCASARSIYCARLVLIAQN